MCHTRSFHLDWRGNHVVITGASSGIGKALAWELAGRGAILGLISRRKNILNELAADISLSGAKVAACFADCGNPEEMDQAVRQAESNNGPVRTMIASAGVGYPTDIDLGNLRQTAETFQTNVMGVIHSFRSVLPGMLERKEGHLAAVSSLGAFMGFPGESAYCASKAAVNTFMEGMRIRLRGTGIRVTTLCPGFVKTPMTEINDFSMPFLIDAPDAARRIVRGLERNQAVACFPWRMSMLVGLLRRCPDSFIQWLFSDYNSKSAGPG